MSAVTDLIGSATDSSYSAPTQYNTWQPQYATQSDNTFNSLAQNNAANNPYTAYAPQFQNVLNQQMNNPYSTGAQTSANNAGTAYTNTGNNAVGTSNGLSSSAMQLLNAGNSIWNTASDPQNALYNQTVQQLQDQVRTGQAARGITMSPVGANLENQALGNFNLDWQNNQLSREATGLSALSGAVGSAGTAGQNAGQLGTSGAQALLAGGTTPQTQFNSNLSNQFNDLSNYAQQTGTNANSLNSSTLSQLLGYMGLAGQQSNSQGNFDQQYWQNQNAYTSASNAQNEAFWGSLGNIGSGALMGGMGGNSGGYNPGPITWNN